jgi:hypothetical protein
VEEVFAVLSDNVSSVDWVPMVDKKTTIRETTPRSRIEYAGIKMPWPLRDRYTVADGSLEIMHGNVYKISYRSVDGEYTDPERIRARIDLSTFYLRPENANSTYIDVSLLSDPMGSVPKFLVNSFQKNWPIQFLTGLRGQIEKVRLKSLSQPTIGTDLRRTH